LLDAVLVLPGGEVRLINPLVYAHAGDAAYRRHLFRVNAAREAIQPPVLLGRYGPETFIDGSGPFHVLTDGIMVTEQLAAYMPDFPANYRYMMARRGDAARVAAPCLLACHPGLFVWSHWLIDTLPKLLLAERAWPGRFSFVVPDCIADPASPRFFVRCVRDSLAAYGIDAARLLRLREGVFYRFDALFDVADLRDESRQLHGGVVAALRDMPGAPGMRGRYPLTAAMRGPGDTRALVNRGEIDRVLRRHGAAELDVHAAPFLEQVRAFRDSAMLVGDMGSNLAYAVYAMPEAGIVTMAPSGWQDAYFANLFRLASLFHADVRGISQPAPGQDIAHAKLSVDPAQLDAGIDAVRRAVTEGLREGVAQLDGREVPRALGAALLRLEFSAGGTALACQRGGFFPPEGTRTWSNGPMSRLLVEHFMPPGGDVWLDISGVAFVHPPALPARLLGVAVNGVRLGDFDVAGETSLQVRIPAPLLGRGPGVGIVFHHGDCPPPKSFGGSDDGRALGFMFETVVLRRPA
jgi:hypothetical protein